jgi:hypothetical protein
LFFRKLRSLYEMLGLLEHRPEVPGEVFRDAKLLGFINKVAADLYCDPALNLFGVVYFNWKLLQSLVRLEDYVIAHALVHLREGHYGPAFWAALGRAFPDWEARKEALLSHGS